MNDINKRHNTMQSVNDLNVRVTALESTNHAHHGEMMRILSEMSTTMKENFKEIKDDVKKQSISQKDLEAKVIANEKEISRVDGKLSRIMGAIGALCIAVVGGIFTLATKYIVR